jgi:uncharacterized membrane protein
MWLCQGFFFGESPGCLFVYIDRKFFKAYYLFQKNFYQQLCAKAHKEYKVKQKALVSAVHCVIGLVVALGTMLHFNWSAWTMIPLWVFLTVVSYFVYDWRQTTAGLKYAWKQAQGWKPNTKFWHAYFRGLGYIISFVVGSCSLTFSLFWIATSLEDSAYGGVGDLAALSGISSFFVTIFATFIFFCTILGLPIREIFGLEGEDERRFARRIILYNSALLPALLFYYLAALLWTFFLMFLDWVRNDSMVFVARVLRRGKRRGIILVKRKIPLFTLSFFRFVHTEARMTHLISVALGFAGGLLTGHVFGTVLWGLATGGLIGFVVSWTLQEVANRLEPRFSSLPV